MLLSLQTEIISYIFSYISDLRDVCNLRVSSKIALIILHETTKELTFSNLNLENLPSILKKFPNVRKISGKIFSLASIDYYQEKTKEERVKESLEKFNILRRITIVDVSLMSYSSTIREIFVRSFARDCRGHKSCLECRGLSRKECQDCKECRANFVQRFNLTLRHIITSSGEDPIDRYQRDLEADDESSVHEGYVKIGRGKLPSYGKDVRAKSLIEGKLVIEDAAILKTPSNIFPSMEARYSVFLYSLLKSVRDTFNIEVAYITSFLYTSSFRVILHDSSSLARKGRNSTFSFLLDLCGSFSSESRKNKVFNIDTLILILDEPLSNKSSPHRQTIEKIIKSGIEIIYI